MRYEKCNPQYIYLLEKIEELESQLRLKDEYRTLAKELLNNRIDLSLKIEEFNSLPWYKKAFYKFEL